MTKIVNNIGTVQGNVRVLPVPWTRDHFRDRLAAAVAEYDERRAGYAAIRKTPPPAFYGEMAGLLVEAARALLDSEGAL